MLPIFLLDHLDPIQLGFVYESLLRNASDSGMNSNRARSYIELAEDVKEAIDANCGFDSYVEGQQELCRKLADYDNRLGYNPTKI